MSNEFYLNNPLVNRNRELGLRDSAWEKQFDCTNMRPLIICRGPIRKEAMDVFTEMGITHFGILLSEKDSIVYRNAIAPELRILNYPDRIHRVPDYSGANKEEREQRIDQIINIARDNNYNAIFAGYGFMAEDEVMVASMENAGLTFIGPCSRTVHDAGLKDEAKRTALKCGVSVTPGIDNGTSLTLLKKHPDVAALQALVEVHDLTVDAASMADSASGDGYTTLAIRCLRTKGTHAIANRHPREFRLTASPMQESGHALRWASRLGCQHHRLQSNRPNDPSRRHSAQSL